MNIVLSAVLPIFLVIALGNIFRRTDFLPMAFWDSINRLCFNALVPALLISAMAGAEPISLDLLPMLGAIVLPVLGLGVLLGLLGPRLPIQGPAFTSLYQGVVRPNAYITFAIALSLFGESGLSMVAIALAPTVPVVNVMSIAILSRHGEKTAENAGVFRALVRNPLIISALIGAFLQATETPLPPIIDDVLGIAGRAALPLALLAVGAGLRIKAAQAAGGTVIATTVLRMAVVPLLTLAVALAFGLEGDALLLAVLFNAVPTATVSYVMARQLGGDAPLMAGIITVQTVVAFVTLPIVLAYLA